ncbi:MAG: ABC transporter permease [Gammaproteobacteria bacterium]|nr:MAG: ABC transporter permease [Gammaproteobacteria bacterium]
MNPKRVAALAWKEWREIVRDRMFFTLAFLVPFLWMLVFGYGLTLDVENIPFAAVDEDQTFLSRDYLHRFTQSRYFDFQGFAESAEALDPLLADNRIRLAIIIPPRFQERLLKGRPSPVQVIIDGVFPYRAMTTKGYVVAINGAFSQEVLLKHLMRQGLSPERARSLLAPVRLEVRYLYNQEVKSLWFLAPSLIMFILMLSPPLLTALSVVREKENGSIYNIYVSTVKRGEFILGKLLPNVGISLINAVLLWLMAVFLFEAPFKGSFPLFLAAALLYVICTTGIGLVVSMLVRTQMAALIITVILTIVPTILYSGLFVPITSLSPSAQVEAHLIPASYFNNVVLGLFLKGVGMEVLWLDMAALALYGAILMGLGYLLFHKRQKV